MPNTSTLAPFDFETLPIYFGQDEIILHPDEPEKYEKAIRSQFEGDEPPQCDGFEVLVFDNEARWDGFVEGLSLLRERDDDICYSWVRLTGQHDGLFGVVVWCDEWDGYTFTDMRGDRVR